MCEQGCRRRRSTRTHTQGCSHTQFRRFCRGGNFPESHRSGFDVASPARGQRRTSAATTALSRNCQLVDSRDSAGDCAAPEVHRVAAD